MNEVLIPKKLEPIVKAFYADSPKVAKKLILQATKAVYATEGSTFFDERREVTKEEIEGVLFLIAGIKPNDLLEALFAAQIVVSHMLGMRKLSSDLDEDLRIGLKMLRFSNEAMQKPSKETKWGTAKYNGKS